MELISKHLRIRDMLRSDASELYPILSDPEVMEFIEPPYDMAAAVDFIERFGLASPPACYALESRETGRVIGHVIFHPFPDMEDAFELGWVLSREVWGHGYASEATEMLIAQAEHTCIKRLVIECVPAHAASARIARCFGFDYAGNFDGLSRYVLELK